MEKLKEEEEVKMCKRIKAPRKITELYGKRLYGEGMKGKDGNGNVKGKGRNMKKDAVIKKEKAHKTVSKNEAGNICNCGNSKGKGNKKVNSIAIPKLNVEDFIISKSDDSNDNNTNRKFL